MKKVAFCFLLYDSVKHSKVWENFFDEDDRDSHSVYAHLKTVTPKTQNWVRDHKIRPVKTDYCHVSLVYAWIRLLQEALKDPSNKYFTILSGECIPLFSYKRSYSKLTRSKKSRINVDMLAESYIDTGLYYADQWCVLTRREAKLLVKLRTTAKGRAFTKCALKQGKGYCPDEVLPVNWFVANYGKPSSKRYRQYIRDLQTTYTYWDGKSYVPKKFNKTLMRKMRKKICESGSVFGRKFYGTAARELAMNC